MALVASKPGRLDTSPGSFSDTRSPGSALSSPGPPGSAMHVLERDLRAAPHSRWGNCALREPSDLPSHTAGEGLSEDPAPQNLPVTPGASSSAGAPGGGASPRTTNTSPSGDLTSDSHKLRCNRRRTLVTAIA